MGGPGPIPLSEMMAFFTLYEIERTSWDWFVRLMCKLDHAYMDHYAEKQKAKNLASQNTAK